jgi:hypothetical protein
MNPINPRHDGAKLFHSLPLHLLPDFLDTALILHCFRAIFLCNILFNCLFMRTSINDLLQLLSARGPMASPALQAALGISQPTVSRLIRDAGSRVLRLGRGRNSRYAAVREVAGVGTGARLYVVDKNGTPAAVGGITALAGAVPFVVQAGEKWLLGEAGNGEFPGLPYFLHDLRPQGFLGRQIANLLAEQQGVYSGNPEKWSDDQVFRYLYSHGAELPGNLIVGDTALNAFLSTERTPVRDRGETYPVLATRILAVGDFGSSAGGEQPKFTAYTEDAGNVIVKFSPAGETPEAVRWRDLLIAEHHALSILADLGLPVAECELYQFGGRVFLESRRFDREGTSGRQAAVSLAALDAEFAGEGEHWIRSARGLHDARVVSQSTLDQIRLAHTYGLWIANSDMHLGNLTLVPEGNIFRLHPVYDMVPMRLAPQRGELVNVELAPPLRNADNFDLWEQAGAYAVRFWRRLSDDERVSESMRKLAAEHATRCQAVLVGWDESHQTYPDPLVR